MNEGKLGSTSVGAVQQAYAQVPCSVNEWGMISCGYQAANGIYRQYYPFNIGSPQFFQYNFGQPVTRPYYMPAPQPYVVPAPQPYMVPRPQPLYMPMVRTR